MPIPRIISPNNAWVLNGVDVTSNISGGHELYCLYSYIHDVCVQRRGLMAIHNCR